MIHHPQHFDWQASCYLLGELSPADQVAFEADLAVSQLAREALARAVELQQATSAALAAPLVSLPVSSPSPVPREGGYRWAWLSAGVAGVLSLAIYFSLGTGSIRSPGVNDELAAAWTEVNRLAAEGDAVVAATVAYTPVSESPVALTAVAIDSESLEAGEAPSWMTAAVYGLAGCPLDSEDRTEDAVDAAGPVEN